MLEIFPPLGRRHSSLNRNSQFKKHKRIRKIPYVFTVSTVNSDVLQIVKLTRYYTPHRGLHASESHRTGTGWGQGSKAQFSTLPNYVRLRWSLTFPCMWRYLGFTFSWYHYPCPQHCIQIIHATANLWQIIHY